MARALRCIINFFIYIQWYLASQSSNRSQYKRESVSRWPQKQRTRGNTERVDERRMQSDCGYHQLRHGHRQGVSSICCTLESVQEHVSLLPGTLL